MAIEITDIFNLTWIQLNVYSCSLKGYLVKDPIIYLVIRQSFSSCANRTSYLPNIFFVNSVVKFMALKKNPPVRRPVPVSDYKQARGLKPLFLSGVKGEKRIEKTRKNKRTSRALCNVSLLAIFVQKRSSQGTRINAVM